MSSPFKSDHTNRASHGDHDYYKRVESNSPFSKPVKSGVEQVRVVDSRSCRQLYLRSAYTFTRQDQDNNNDNNNTKKKVIKERAKKCLGRAQHRVALLLCKRTSRDHKENKGEDLVIFTRVKQLSCVSLLTLLRRMLACNSLKVEDHPPSDQFPPLPWKFL